MIFFVIKNKKRCRQLNEDNLTEFKKIIHWNKYLLKLTKRVQIQYPHALTNPTF